MYKNWPATYEELLSSFIKAIIKSETLYVNELAYEYLLNVKKHTKNLDYRPCIRKNPFSYRIVHHMLLQLLTSYKVLTFYNLNFLTI